MSNHCAGADLDEQILDLLRGTVGEHMTGMALSEHLVVPRDCVVKHIRRLRQQGYEIEGHPHLGYRLVSAPDLLLPQEIRHGLTSQVMGQRMFCYRRVRSTNLVALRLAQGGAPEGTLVLAEEQIAGRGRLGRIWHSAPHLGLWLSLVLRPAVSPDRIFQLAICGALAVAEVINCRTHLPVRLKWPNDVLIRGGKVAGLLAETQLEGDVASFVVLGLGINVNHDRGDFPEDIKGKATSIRLELGRKFSRVILLRDLLAGFEHIYGQYQDRGLDPFLNRWRQLSGILGRRVTVRVGERELTGLAVDFEDTGALVLEEASGNRRRLLAGDVSLVEEEPCGWS